MTFQEWVSEANARLNKKTVGIFHRLIFHVKDRAYWAGIGCYVIVEPRRTSDEAFEVCASFESINVTGKTYSDSVAFSAGAKGIAAFIDRAALFFRNAPTAEK